MHEGVWIETQHLSEQKTRQMTYDTSGRINSSKSTSIGGGGCKHHTPQLLFYIQNFKNVAQPRYGFLKYFRTHEQLVLFLYIDPTVHLNVKKKILLF